MKNSTIQLLHLGKKRKVDKQEYLKLRGYNKIKTCRSAADETMRAESTSRTYEQCSYTVEKLMDVIDCLNKDNHYLNDENIKLMKQIKKGEKIERMIFKKFPALGFNANTKNEENLRDEEPPCHQNDYQSMLELKLSLQVVELETQLQQRVAEQKRLENNKRMINEQKVQEGLFKEKTRFLNFLFNWQQISDKVQMLGGQRCKIDELMDATYARQKNNKKIKAKSLKNLEQLKYQIKDLERSAQERKKRIRKGSCQYIEIENGEVRYQQDILKQLKQIQQKIKEESEDLQLFLEGKMLQKISLINQIEKYQPTCSQLAQARDKEKVRYSIKLI